MGVVVGKSLEMEAQSKTNFPGDSNDFSVILVQNDDQKVPVSSKEAK